MTFLIDVLTIITLALIPIVLIFSLYALYISVEFLKQDRAKLQSTQNDWNTSEIVPLKQKIKEKPVRTVSVQKFYTRAQRTKEAAESLIPKKFRNENSNTNI